MRRIAELARRGGLADAAAAAARRGRAATARALGSARDRARAERPRGARRHGLPRHGARSDRARGRSRARCSTALADLLGHEHRARCAAPARSLRDRSPVPTPSPAACRPTRRPSRDRGRARATPPRAPASTRSSTRMIQPDPATVAAEVLVGAARSAFGNLAGPPVDVDAIAEELCGLRVGRPGRAAPRAPDARLGPAAGRRAAAAVRRARGGPQPGSTTLHDRARARALVPAPPRRRDAQTQLLPLGRGRHRR